MLNLSGYWEWEGGKRRGKGVEAQLWVREGKLDGWIILVKGGGKHFRNNFPVSVQGRSIQGKTVLCCWLKVKQSQESPRW